ncbi:cadherin repeat domain-containing protein, partial [Flavobacteriaceae bacterium]|nr:cadherin repeat domain-containing protein [Flavobacteriaceae bacterium]
MKSSTFKSIILTLLLLLTKLSNAQSGSLVTLGRYWGGNSKFFQVVLTILSLLFVQNIIAQTVTNLNDSGTGSLRQSIVDAEANAGADTISFTSGLVGTITLASDLPNITENLTIIGPGIGLVLSGNNSWKMFNVTNNAQLTISQMTFSYCAQSIADNTGSVFNVGSGSKIYADNIRLTNNAWLIGHTFNNTSDGTVLSISNSEVSNNITTNTNWAQEYLFSCRHGSTPNYPIIESDEKNRLLFENVTFLNNNTPKLIYSTRFLKINNCTFTGNKQIFFNFSANRQIVTNSTFTSNTPDPDPTYGVASLFHTNNWYTQMYNNWHIDPTWGNNFNLYDNNSFSNNGGDILISYNSNWSASGGADYLSNYDLNGGKTFTTISNNTGTHQAALTFVSSSGSGVILLNNTVRPNSTPTNITLNPTTVNENVSIGTTVGSLSTTDSDSGDSHTYSLVAGSGDTDNASFSISGANLLTGTALDYETKNSYSIRVQTSDGTATYAKTFTITVAD